MDVLQLLNVEEQTYSQFHNRLFVITGALSRYSREEAYALIRRCGGKTSDNPVNNKDYLVLGQAVWSELNNGIAPRKVVKVQELVASGRDVKLVSEDEFYAMLDNVPSSFITDSAPPKEDTRLPFDGLTFILSGTPKRLSRAELAAWLEKLGARISSSPTKKTSYLVICMDAIQSKIEKAKELGINIISDDELLRMLDNYTIE